MLEDLFHREAALRGELFEWHADIRVLPEVFARSGDRAAIFFGQSLFGRLHHYFQQLKNGGYLIWAELLDQFMDVLLRSRHLNGHSISLRAIPLSGARPNYRAYQTNHGLLVAFGKALRLSGIASIAGGPRNRRSRDRPSAA